MSVVLCDLFRLYYDSEHGEKVSKCPLCTKEETQCERNESDLDITGRIKEHADEKRPTNKEHRPDTLQKFI